MDSFLRTDCLLSPKWNDDPPFAIIVGAIGSTEVMSFKDDDRGECSLTFQWTAKIAIWYRQ